MAGNDVNIAQQLFATQQMGGNAQAPDAKKPAESMDNVVNGIPEWILKMLGVLGIKASNTMNTGILAHLNIDKAAPIPAGKNIMPASPLAMGGGALAQVASVFKWDLGKISGLSIDPLTMNSGVDISPASLGDLPMQLANVGSGAGMGAGFSMNA